MGSINIALLLRLGIAQFEAGDAVSAYTTAFEFRAIQGLIAIASREMCVQLLNCSKARNTKQVCCSLSCPSAGFFALALLADPVVPQGM